MAVHDYLMKMKRMIKKFFTDREKVAVIIFLAPSLIGFSMFFFIPFVMGIYYSFVDSIFEPAFAGIRNYLDLFASDSFKIAGENSLKFTALCVPLNMVLSFCLALLVNQKIYFKNTLRMLLVTPLVVPVASVVLFWQIVMDANGTLNYYIANFGGQPIDWLKSDWAMLVIVVIYLWKNIGYSLILFLAGLQNIPAEYYESACIDGAGAWKKLTKITIVYIVPTAFFVFIMSILNSFKVFREVYLMTGDYPSDSIYLLQHYMNNTFASLDFQKLTSAAVVMAAIIYSLVLVLFRFERKLGENIIG